MKRFFNVFLTLIVTFLSFTVCTTNSFAVESVSDTSVKIYDYGNLLTDTEETYLKGLVNNYISKYNYDMVIVTKSNYSATDTAMMNYADDFYDYNNFGIGNTKDGILLFLNVDSLGPVVWISTTGNAILMYDDARISSLKSAMSSVKNNGNSAIVEAFINKASDYAEAGIPSSNKHAYIDENGDYQIKKTYPVSRNIIISVVGSTIILLIMIFKNKMVKKATTAIEYLDKKSINIYNRRDNFINTYTSRTKIETSSGGGGGSSTHRGSSGTSHGGGGGRL